MENFAVGAEAVLKKDDETITKDRLKKGYRIKDLDESLRKKRTRLEARLLREARRIINAPQVIEESGFTIRMEFIDGKKVKDILNDGNCAAICRGIAAAVARLHSHGIIHGDLTTSNMILKNDEIYLIDFGLGFFSGRVEDKATDLHLLHEALESTHFGILEKAWKIILNTYKEQYAEAEEIIKTLSEIEKRGRYKER